MTTFRTSDTKLQRQDGKIRTVVPPDAPDNSATAILSSAGAAVSISDNSSDETTLTTLSLNGDPVGTWAISGGSWAKAQLIGDTSAATIVVAVDDADGLDSGDQGEKTVTITHGALDPYVLTVTVTDSSAVTTLGSIKVSNDTGSEFTGAIDFGLSIMPDAFDPSTERLTVGDFAQVTGHDVARWLRCTRMVTVPANSEVIVFIEKETAAPTTPATLTVAQLLALDTDWTHVLTFTDTSDQDWTVDLRDVMANGTTTFGVDSDYISASPFRNTATVKEYVIYAPFRDSGGTAHPRLAVMGSVIFYSDDNFTTLHSIAPDLSITNSRRFSTATDNVPVVGELVITSGIASPTTVVSHTKRAIGGGDYSTTNRTFSNFASANFTLDDAGKLLIADGGFEMVLFQYVSATSMQGGNTAGSLGSFTTGPITNAVLWPLWVDPGAAIPLRVPHYPNANPLIARQKTQEIRDNYMIANNPVVRGISSSWAQGTGILAPCKISGSPAAGHMHRNESSNEIYIDHGFKILNNVDGDGYISPATYDFLIKADETAGGAVLNGHFIDQSTGLFDGAGNWRIASGVYGGGAKFYSTIDSFAAHQSLFGFVRWVLTGKWTSVRDLYMRAKAQQVVNYTDGATKNVITSGFYALGGVFTRPLANYIQLHALAGRAMPTCAAGCLLPTSNEEIRTWLNTINYEEAVDQFGIGATKTQEQFPQWSLGMPYVNYAGGTNQETGDYDYDYWTNEYFQTATIDAIEAGLLTEKSKRFLTMLLYVRIGGLSDAFYSSTTIQKDRLVLDRLGLNNSPQPRIPHETEETPAAYWNYIMNNLASNGSTSYIIYKTMPLIWAKEHISELYEVNSTHLQAGLSYLLAAANSVYGVPLVEGGTDIDWNAFSPNTDSPYRIILKPRS